MVRGSRALDGWCYCWLVDLLQSVSGKGREWCGWSSRCKESQSGRRSKGWRREMSERGPRQDFSNSIQVVALSDPKRHGQSSGVLLCIVELRGGEDFRRSRARRVLAPDGTALVCGVVPMQVQSSPDRNQLTLFSFPSITSTTLSVYTPRLAPHFDAFVTRSSCLNTPLPFIRICRWSSRLRNTLFEILVPFSVPCALLLPGRNARTAWKNHPTP